MYGFKKTVFCFVLLVCCLSSVSVFAEDAGDATADNATSTSTIGDLLSTDSSEEFSGSADTFISRMKSMFTDLSTFESAFQYFLKEAITFIPFSYWFLFVLLIVNAIFLSVYHVLR